MPYYMFGDRSQPEYLQGVRIACAVVIESRNGTEREIACFDTLSQAKQFANKLAARFTDRSFYAKK